MIRGSADALRSQALAEFELPLAPGRVTTLRSGMPDAEALDLTVPAGRFYLLVTASGPLTLAFESTLFDLLHESRYPAPAPRRAHGGGLIARLSGPGGPAAAACYARPAGEHVEAAAGNPPRWLEIGRLLARLHQLGEAHPASVHDPLNGSSLASKLPEGPDAAALAPVLGLSLEGLPLGAAHGQLGPRQVLFVGDRISGVLPSGRAASMALVLDLAQAVAAWALHMSSPLPALRSIVSGYQAMRRLVAEEREALFDVLRLAAAREGAVGILEGLKGDPLAALRAVDALGRSSVRSAAG